MKKNLFTIITLSIFFALFLGAGIYSLLQSKGNLFSKYNVNKYQDVANWCDTSIEGSELSVNCKGLLLNISTQEDTSVCFDVQVITKNKELKDLNVCVSENTLTYTNDLLGYKKLMPVDMVFTYTKEGILNDYSFTSVSFDKVNDTYVQGIVNEDIANLVTIDPSTTTIQNSVDFCPRPETLPDYVTEANKTAYTEYFNKNILTEEEYTNLYTTEFRNVFLENWIDPKINILFGCESSNRLGYSAICDTTLGSKYNSTELAALPTFVSDWNNSTNVESDLIGLKNTSLILDGMLYKQPHANYSSTWIIKDLFQFISDANNNQNVYCSGYKIYEKLAQYNSTAEAQLEQIRTLVANNLTSASSICLDVLDKSLYSKDGFYLKSLNTKDSLEFNIYKKCNNLYLLISNE